MNYINDFVTIEKNNSLIFSAEEIVTICKRHNNLKRDFLFVNPLLGKYIHVSPDISFSIFKELSDVIKKSIGPNEKILVIGFAETATALGHYIACTIPNCIYYMQTTREIIPNAKPILNFREEHSHAPNHFLYGSLDELMKCERIIFVDDEITTGNTILNFIKEIETLGVHAKYSAASLLNWQNNEYSQRFSELCIDKFFLLRGKLKDLNAKVPVKIKEDKNFELTNLIPTIISINSDYSDYYIERIGWNPLPLNVLKENLFNKIFSKINFNCKSESILILGTEEFMFMPMLIGKIISEKSHQKVQFHATARSPIETSCDASYSITSKYSISSCYESNRKTFIYNLEKYDKVYIITDVTPTPEFVQDITSALLSVGCSIENITIITLNRNVMHERI